GAALGRIRDQPDISLVRIDLCHQRGQFRAIRRELQATHSTGPVERGLGVGFPLGAAGAPERKPNLRTRYGHTHTVGGERGVAYVVQYQLRRSADGGHRPELLAVAHEENTIAALRPERSIAILLS